MHHVLVHALATGTTATQSSGSAALPFDITQILQFGLLGLIFLCLVFRKFIVPEWTLNEFKERSDAEKAEMTARLVETKQQLDKLQMYLQDQMIPTLTRSAEINTRYTEELQRARYSRQSQTPPPEPND